MRRDLTWLAFRALGIDLELLALVRCSEPAVRWIPLAFELQDSRGCNEDFHAKLREMYEYTTAGMKRTATLSII